ncbi:hypothetical protein ACFWSF_35230 [Streptomyces sp. NPDC058611]|uniref:hypothetical protein n=1 Tax=unclassified Streptomyces TaxID=2593676 RepID=UPI00366537F0
MRVRMTDPQERLERLQGLLSGTGTDSRVARNLARTQKTNLMFGLALHAADRLRQGETPTELEEKLLDVLRVFLPEEEVKEWGRVYREQVATRGALVGVPATVTARPVSAGYDLTDLARDMPAVSEEWKAQSNSSLIDTEALAAGADFDSPDFIEGMREWGFGVSVPAAPSSFGAGDTAQEGKTPDPVFDAELWFDKFHVHETVGDGWPGKRDEIRWVSCGSSDLAPAVPFLSEEYGEWLAVEGATTGIGERVFRGKVSSGLVLTVECWEWDTGDGNDGSIGEQLIEWNSNVWVGTAWSVLGAMAPGNLMGLLMDLTSAAITFVSLLVKNDLSSARTFFLDRAALAELSAPDPDPRSTQWHFNGDGHHELTVRFAGKPVPFPDLEYVVHDGSSWDTPVTLPWQSATAPALVSYQGRLHALFVRPGDRAVMWSRMEGQTWSSPGSIRGWASYHAPALTVFKDTLYCVVVALDGTARWATCDGTSWSKTTVLPGTHTEKAPGLTADENTMFLAQVAPGDQTVRIKVTDNGSTWTNESTWTRPRIPCPISAATAGGQVFIAMCDEEENVLSQRWDYQWWSTTIRTPSGWRTGCGPTVVDHGGAWLLLRASDGSLRASTFRESAHRWADTHFVGAGGERDPITPMEEVAAHRHDGKLYVMYRR